MMRTLNWFGLGLAVFGVLPSIPAIAQNFDTSGNGTVKGAYFVRQLLTANLDQTTSKINLAVSIIGTMTFDGNGNYAFSGQMMNSSNSSATAYTTKGTYSVQSNGLTQIQNPIDNSIGNGTDIEYGAVGGIGPSAIVASSTEGPYDDIFVAIPIGSSSSVSGSYRVGFTDFLGANASQVRDGYYTLTATGSGSFGTVMVSGAMANQGSNNTTQSLSGVTYSLTAGTGAINFPVSSTPLSALVSGAKSFSVSSDGNILLGGSSMGSTLSSASGPPPA